MHIHPHVRTHLVVVAGRLVEGQRGHHGLDEGQQGLEIFV
jgi:hypothetical protein